MERIVAVDIDLHRMHAWDDTEQEVLGVDTDLAHLLTWLALHTEPVTLLVECGSVHTYGNVLLKKKQAWLIYNCFKIGQMSAIITGSESLRHVKMLISPSSTWTHQYDETKRHMLAEVKTFDYMTKDQNHNVSECQAMVWFYRAHAADWVEVREFLECL